MIAFVIGNGLVLAHRGPPGPPGHEFNTTVCCHVTNPEAQSDLIKEMVKLMDQCREQIGIFSEFFFR